MIIVLLGTKDAGYYTNYLSLIGIPFLVFSPLINFLFPIISSLQGEDGKMKIQLIKSHFRDFSFAISPALTLYFIICGPVMARFFFTDKFLQSGYILAWSAPFLVFNFLIQINFQILAGLGQIKTRMKILLVGLAFNLVLNFAFIHLFGVYGSALAVGISWIPIWYLSNRATSEFSTPFSYGFLLKNIAVALAVSVVIYSVMQTEKLQSLMGSRTFLILWLPLTAIFYIIAFMASNRSLVRTIKTEILAVARKPKSVS